MNKVHADLAGKSPLGIVARSLSVESNLSDHQTLSDPVVSLDELRELRFKLEAAISEHEVLNAESTGKHLLSIASELRKNLELLATQVNDIAMGDISILGSSGFPIEHVLDAQQQLLPPNELETRISSVRGTVELAWKPVSGAYSYQVYMTDQDPNNENSWYPIGVTSKTAHLVNELESARFYWFRLTAIGADGESNMSRFARGIAA